MVPLHHDVLIEMAGVEFLAVGFAAAALLLVLLLLRRIAGGGRGKQPRSTA